VNQNASPEAELAKQLSLHLRNLGWSEVSGIAPAAWRPDLVATDGHGVLLCIDLSVGSTPLHSRVLSTLTRAQADLSETWPGRAVVALLSTNPVSERLQSALSSTGIVALHFDDAEDLPAVTSELIDAISSNTAGSLPDSGLGTNVMNRASFALDAGRWEEAEGLYRKILSDQIRVLGQNHPSTFETKELLASLLQRTGRQADALAAYREIIDDRIRVFGPDHPDTLTTRNNLAHWLGESGRVEEAIAQLRQVLADRARVLGPDHPDTLATRSNLAHWLGQSGNTGRL
jgi:tetratricopeptide (TPR) repeat protein